MKKALRTNNAWYYIIWGIGSVAYMMLTFFAPVTNNDYNLGNLQISALYISVLLPITAIWLAAVYGAERFKRYADSIRDSRDGVALAKVAMGLITLVFGTIGSSIFSSVRSYLVTGTHLVLFTHISTVIQWVVYLAAFYTMWRGASQLSHQVAPAKAAGKAVLVLLVPYVALSVWYVTAMLHNPYRTSTPDALRHGSLYLSDPMLIMTIILPYLLIWLIGIFTIAHIWSYQANVKGIIYRKALRRLGLGIVAVIGFSIFAQLFGTAGDALNGISLQGIVALLFVIVGLYSLGYLIIALGARDLAKLEEV